MTTFTVIFPHAAAVPISVTCSRCLGDGVTLTQAYRASLLSVLRLVRLAGFLKQLTKE